ncbi:MAG TPA: sulfatase-like hydrolase/transferase [Thermoanaerobaculia bacterium]|nr:sulfatase-like hydrolase/transferase [Thermoanaerobaculia bacterium]
MDGLSPAPAQILRFAQDDNGKGGHGGLPLRPEARIAVSVGAGPRACPPAVAAKILALAALVLAGCGAPPKESGTSAATLPAILLVTLDTTRADAVAPEAGTADTPNLAALAARGVRFTQAYTTAPMTLPAHASMMTGLYPAGHGVHDNARYLAEGHPRLAERLKAAGYRTAAFISGLPLDRQFGLARGFDLYDDDLGPGASERSAAATTERALAHLAATPDAPLFLWVHYFDPHDPYQPPEPFRSRYPGRPYHAEVAAMDHELGRLLAGFEGRFAARGTRVLAVGDHGEGLGDHGEAYHGNLLYQGVMRVPLVIAATRLPPGVRSDPVSTRHVFGTIAGWAAGQPAPGLLAPAPEVVLGEAMKPYLLYGWQPQVMAVAERRKAIRAGELELYDVVADPGEVTDLAGTQPLPRPQAEALRDYPIPGQGAAEAGGVSLSAEDRAKLASLGYVAAETPPRLDPAAPSPRRRAHLFQDLDRGSFLFTRERYREAIPVFERVLAQDPRNLSVALRLAVAHSVLGAKAAALAWFERAAGIEPDSLDLTHYRAMHHFRFGEWRQAAPLLETVLAAQPERLPALECLAQIREREGRLAEATALLERIVALERKPAASLVKLGDLAMERGDTAAALSAFERARDLDDAGFPRWLELGVCYLADRRLPEARDSLDRVPAEHPAYAMALFKRAQVAVLLDEPNKAERVRRARQKADQVTRPLIEGEPLFTGLGGTR